MTVTKIHSNKKSYKFQTHKKKMRYNCLMPLNANEILTHSYQKTKTQGALITPEAGRMWSIRNTFTTMGMKKNTSATLKAGWMVS